MRFTLVLLLISILSCSSSSGAMQCPGLVDEGPGGCKQTWSPCPDGHRYEIGCVPAATLPYPCTCKVDDAVTKTFSTTEGCSITETADGANRSCGFHLQ